MVGSLLATSTYHEVRARQPGVGSQRVDRAQLAQAVGGAGSAEHRPQQDEDAGQQRRGAEADHARGHGRTEDVRRVVGAEREAQEQAAREKDQDGEIHPGSPRCLRAERRAHSDRLIA